MSLGGLALVGQAAESFGAHPADESSGCGCLFVALGWLLTREDGTIAAEKVTPRQYDRWPEDHRADVEIADGRAVATAVPSARRRRAARLIANALDAAGGSEWNADVAVEIRLTEAPLTVRRPDVVVYRADALDAAPMHADQVLCVVELVSSNSLATGRIVGVHRYAQAGIGHYWRIEWSATGVPVACAYDLDPASQVYQEHAIQSGLVHVTTPFPVTINLTQLS